MFVKPLAQGRIMTEVNEAASIPFSIREKSVEKWRKGSQVTTAAFHTRSVVKKACGAISLSVNFWPLGADLGLVSLYFRFSLNLLV